MILQEVMFLQESQGCVYNFFNNTAGNKTNTKLYFLFSDSM